MAERTAFPARVGLAVRHGWRVVVVVTTMIAVLILAALWTALDALTRVRRR